jgi:hypothetical protein
MKESSNLTANFPLASFKTSFTSIQASPHLLKKLNTLHALLLGGKGKYEQIATVTSDRDLRRTILSLAQASNQYACELSCQLHTLGGISAEESPAELEAETGKKSFSNESEVLNFCMANEQRMVKAYHEILNEPCRYEGLRSMIHYQLNGILCAFVQVKQLNSLSRHYSTVLS